MARRVTFLTLGSVLLAAVGIVDFWTGYELSFSIFYLIPISLVVWTIGAPEGYIMAVIAALVWLLVDLKGGQHYSNAAFPYYNASVRLIFFLIVVFLLGQRKAIEAEQAKRQELEIKLRLLERDLLGSKDDPEIQTHIRQN